MLLSSRGSILRFGTVLAFLCKPYPTVSAEGVHFPTSDEDPIRDPTDTGRYLMMNISSKVFAFARSYRENLYNQGKTYNKTLSHTN
jgi:hypothetical protein